MKLNYPIKYEHPDHLKHPKPYYLVNGNGFLEVGFRKLERKKKHIEHVLELQKKKINSVEIDIGQTLKKNA